MINVEAHAINNVLSGAKRNNNDIPGTRYRLVNYLIFITDYTAGHPGSIVSYPPSPLYVALVLDYEAYRSEIEWSYTK